MEPDRRLRTNEKPNRAIFFSWLAVVCVLLAMTGPFILEGRFPGPDDSLRLVQVRDLLAGQGWYDLHQYRMTPPDGTLMHWSRLADAPIAALIWFFSVFFEQDLAERIAMVIVPLVILLFIMFAIGRLAWRIFDRQMAIFSCLVLAALPPIVMQTQPLRIDHHGWQILAVALSVWALSWRSPGKGGALAGMAMGVGMMISLEVLPMSAAFALVLGLRWMRSDKDRWWLVSYMQGLAGTMVVAFLIARGSADLAQHCDVISPAHLGLFLITALATGLFAAVPSMPRVLLVLGMTLAGALGVGFMAWSAPQCIANPFTDLDPVVRQFWYDQVTEGKPVWQITIDRWLPALVQTLAALVISLRLAAKSYDWARVWWFEYSLVLGLAIIGGLLTSRSIAFASVLSAIPLAWLLHKFFGYWKATNEIGPKILAALAMYAVFIPGGWISLSKNLIAMVGSETQQIVGTRESSCELATTTRLLNTLEPSVIFAPLDISPILLRNTHHSVVASGHHRAQPAMRDVITALINPADDALPIIARRKADYVVACVDLTEAGNLKVQGGPNSLINTLVEDRAPPWLERLDIGGPDALRVWKFTPPSVDHDQQDLGDAQPDSVATPE